MAVYLVISELNLGTQVHRRIYKKYWKTEGMAKGKLNYFVTLTTVVV